jgi:hypothetical protein
MCGKHWTGAIKGSTQDSPGATAARPRPGHLGRVWCRKPVQPDRIVNQVPVIAQAKTSDVRSPGHLKRVANSWDIHSTNQAFTPSTLRER